MSKVKTRIERFDEAFKMLLIVMTLTFSGSIAFFKEIMEPTFFLFSALFFVITIVLWTVSTLRNGESEYFWKVIAWYFLMMVYGVIFARLWFTVFFLPPFVVSFISIVNLALTLPILQYLKEIFGEKNYKDINKVLVFVTLIFIILDVLYSLGLFHPTRLGIL